MKKVLFTSADLEKEITPEYQAMLDEIVKDFKKDEYDKWEKETLGYAPDYYTIENDYDDDYDVI